jgi:DNA-directed RNA polymerase III subunit RPC7
MSRGFARGGRGGRGGGRGSFGGSNNPLPMGLAFADLQNLSREASALYPVCSCTLLISNILKYLNQ